MSEFLCSAIKFYKDDDGNEKHEVSPHLRELNTDNTENMQYVEIMKNVIDSIKSISHCLGLFSSKLVDVCEFDRKHTSDLIVKNLSDGELFDCLPPYNNIWLDRKNIWKFVCLEKYYHIDKNILFLDDSFPTIINIKRSSGKMQKAIMNNVHALSLYKTSKDDYKNLHLGVKIHFYKENDVDENTKVLQCDYRKIILIEDLLKYNENITEINFKFELIKPSEFIDKETNESKEIVCSVINYFNKKYVSWLNDTIKTKLDEEYNSLKYNIHIN